MKTLLTCTAAVVLGLAINSLALADKGGPKGHSSQGSHSTPHSYTPQHNYTPQHSYKPYHGSHPVSYKNSYKSSKYTNYHLTHGKKFSKGYYYPGKYHNHWQYSCYSKKFGCYIYCCPWTNCWYYWCAPDCCYYPVCYVPYSCYCWGAPVCYCSAPCPPVDVVVPEPVSEIGPSE